jgi:hypothetical protein
MVVRSISFEGLTMASGGTTNILGIPVPSTDPVFLALVVIHIGFGIAAVVSGAIAMLSSKGRGRHAGFGTIYFWSLCGLSATMSALSFLRWAEDYHLFALGVLAFAFAYFGRLSIRALRPRWHLAGMGMSYVVMLTAFYVDNGKNLPVWRDLPRVAYWIVPAAIGVPLIAYCLFRLPAFRR